MVELDQYRLTLNGYAKPLEEVRDALDLNNKELRLEEVNRLISEAKVNANDGKFYGSRGEGYIRLIIASFIEDTEVFAAMNRMADLFRKMAAEKHIV